MDRPVNHDEFAELLGAYALDALDADEARLVAEHVARCPRCAAEVADHHEVVGMIANVGADAPPELWDRIAARIAAPGPVERVPAPLGAVSRAGIRPLSSARSTGVGRFGWSAIGVAAAAAAAVIAVLAVQVARLDNRVGQVDRAIAQQGTAQAVLRAETDPHATRVSLAPAGSGPVAQLVILPTGTGYVVNQRLPALAAGRTYQLWGFVHGQPVSLGLLTRHPTYETFTVDPSAPVASFAVTDESAGGSPRPTATPLAVGTATT
ncbi:MAG TPA: anti-sigma factor [Acidimicrobiales bacterium]|nr:anti-sigma factor [Acidimicrobiales bacterium]